MGIAKKAVEGAVGPAKGLLSGIKRNPLSIIGVLAVLLIAFRFRTQIMSLLGKIPFVGSGAAKLSGEG